MKFLKSKLPEVRVMYIRGEHQRSKISNSADAYAVLKPLYNEEIIEYIEYSYALFLNRANNTIGWMLLSQGGTCATVIDIKVLFTVALQCGAHSVIVSHNHPSGVLTPSEADRKLTRQVKEVGDLLQITLLDHIILTTDNYFSFADEGCL